MTTRVASVRIAATVAAATVATTAALLTAEAARAADIFGPPFGSNSVTSEILDVAGTPDLDAFVADLFVGERVTAEVSATSGSALHPALRLTGPDGVDVVRTADELAPGAAAGGFARIAPFTIPRTGRWAVTVLSADGTEGAYRVRFRIASPKAARATGRLGGTEPLTYSHPVDAADGSLATISVSSRGAQPVRVVGIADPAGNAIATVPERTSLGSRRTVLTRLPLLAGTGSYRVTLAVESGTASYTISSAVEPPQRPSGGSTLTSSEPFLPLRAAPVEGLASQPLRLDAANLPRSTLPSVRFGDVEASVLRVGPGGSYADVIPPAAADGSVVSVTIVNPDGQSTTRESYFRYLPASTPPLKSITPVVTQVYANELATFYVDTNLAAPPTGRQVALSVTNKIALLPATITIPAGTRLGQFVLQAAPTSGSGLVSAFDGNKLSATVTILPARRVDLSAWRIVQANAAATFQIPVGTALEAGGFLVVARNASRGAFESYWGRTLGPNVVFLNAEGTFPLIDGAERYSLALPSGVVVDGQTIALASGQNCARVPGKPAGTTSSWTVAAATSFTATPGSGPATTVALPYISEFSDTPAGGSNAYQFVEIRFDRGQ